MNVRPWLVALLFCFIFSAAFGQNWRLLDPGREAYFGASASGFGYVWECLRIDSVRVIGQDSVFYPCRRIAPSDEVGVDTCRGFSLDYTGFGPRIVRAPNGDYTFYDWFGSPYLIKTRPTANWVVNSHLPLGTSILADAITYKDTMILGQPDSLVTARFSFYSELGDLYHRQYFKASKNHGLIYWPSMLKYFPGYGKLLGLSNPALGVQDIPKEQFFTMQAGDTIVSRQYENHTGSTSERLQRDSYLQRLTSPSGDSIFFEIRREEVVTHTNWVYSVVLPPRVYWDTIAMNAPHIQRLDRKFGEIWNNDANASDWIREWRVSGGRLLKPTNVKDSLRIADSCMVRGRSGGPDCPYDTYYIDGLGGPYYFCQTYLPDPLHYVLRRPEYARLGGVTVLSSPFLDMDSLLSLDPSASLSVADLKIYPNPASEQVTVDLGRLPSGAAFTVVVTDMQGRELIVEHGRARGVLELGVGELPAGIYALRVQCGFQTGRGRFFKR